MPPPRTPRPRCQPDAEHAQRAVALDAADQAARPWWCRCRARRTGRLAAAAAGRRLRRRRRSRRHRATAAGPARTRGRAGRCRSRASSSGRLRAGGAAAGCGSACGRTTSRSGSRMSTTCSGRSSSACVGLQLHQLGQRRHLARPPAAARRRRCSGAGSSAARRRGRRRPRAARSAGLRGQRVEQRGGACRARRRRRPAAGWRRRRRPSPVLLDDDLAGAVDQHELAVVLPDRERPPLHQRRPRRCRAAGARRSRCCTQVSFSIRARAASSEKPSSLSPRVHAEGGAQQRPPASSRGPRSRRPARACPAAIAEPLAQAWRRCRRAAARAPAGTPQRPAPRATSDPAERGPEQPPLPPPAAASAATAGGRQRQRRAWPAAQRVRSRAACGVLHHPGAQRGEADAEMRRLLRQQGGRRQARLGVHLQQHQPAGLARGVVVAEIGPAWRRGSRARGARPAPRPARCA